MKSTKKWRAFGGTQHWCEHTSDACGGDMALSVFVPPGDGPFPVVTFLSGLTCTAENFTTKAGAQRVAAELGLIVVAPDTSPRGAGYAGEDDDWDFGTGAGFYVDATEAPWSARYRMFTYVTEELPAQIDAAFPTKGPSHRAIFGHSMGGHGALVIGLRQPARWRSVSALAPIVAPSQVPWGEKAFAGYLGDDREAWRRYDATELVRETQRADTLLIDQGTADSFLERELKPELFQKACADAGQPLTLRMQDGYDHSYYFIATFVEDHLRHHAAHLA
ncbi:MAG: S-formylglutathione hydrolase [Sandaracinaceae bacterium]